MIGEETTYPVPEPPPPQVAASEKLTFSVVIKYEIHKCEIKHQNKQVITSKLVIICCAYNTPPPTFPTLIFLLFSFAVKR